jgi:hypothetical protein
LNLTARGADVDGDVGVITEQSVDFCYGDKKLEASFERARVSRQLVAAERVRMQVDTGIARQLNERLETRPGAGCAGHQLRMVRPEAVSVRGKLAKAGVCQQFPVARFGGHELNELERRAELRSHTNELRRIEALNEHGIGRGGIAECPELGQQQTRQIDSVPAVPLRRLDLRIDANRDASIC